MRERERASERGWSSACLNSNEMSELPRTAREGPQRSERHAREFAYLFTHITIYSPPLPGCTCDVAGGPATKIEVYVYENRTQK